MGVHDRDVLAGGVTKPAKKPVPFAWVLDALGDAAYETRAMFGTTAVYLGGKIVLALRDKGAGDDDDGVWVATDYPHHASLRAELPSMRSITVFGDGESGWQVLPKDGDDFEEEVSRVVAMVLAGDGRVGKVPKAKKKKKAGAGATGRGAGPSKPLPRMPKKR